MEYRQLGSDHPMANDSDPELVRPCRFHLTYLRPIHQETKPLRAWNIECCSCIDNPICQSKMILPGSHMLTRTNAQQKCCKRGSSDVSELTCACNRSCHLLVRDYPPLCRRRVLLAESDSVVFGGRCGFHGDFMSFDDDILIVHRVELNFAACVIFVARRSGIGPPVIAC